MRTARDLEARFAALSRSQKIIASGCSACCVGLALWAVGYSVNQTLGLFSVLAPTGVVTIIVGLGIACFGALFYFTEPTGKPSDLRNLYPTDRLEVVASGAVRRLAA